MSASYLSSRGDVENNKHLVDDKNKIRSIKKKNNNNNNNKNEVDVIPTSFESAMPAYC